MIERYVAFLYPACTSPNGWISIAGADTDTTHDFIWAPSTTGDGVQYFYDNGVLTLEPAGRGRAFCLYTEVRTGACCYMQTGTCVNGEQEDVWLGQPDTYFEVNTLCAALDPPCAQCDGAGCNRDTDECVIETYTDCAARGAPWEWLGCGSTCNECIG